MKRKAFEWTSITAFIFFSTTCIAAEVTLSHTFTPGSPAKADEVNQNFSDIKTAVDDNHSRITATESASATNATAITGNTAAINQNSTSISTISAAIDSNASRITANESDIGTNATAISGNTAAVNQNNASISFNTTAIDNNSTRISANETALAASQQPVSIYDAGHNRLGRYMGVAPLIGSAYSKWVHQGAVVWILSDNGYLMPLQRTYGITVASLRGLDYFQAPTNASDYTINIATVYYESNNCTGPEYLSASQLDAIAYTGFSPAISVHGGIVFQATDMSGAKVVSYLPQNSTEAPIAYQSTRAMNVTACSTNSAQVLEDALVIYPNNPEVTAVSNNTQYSWPLTFGY